MKAKLAFISNVGTFGSTHFTSTIWDGNVPIPLGLYLHADQVMQWQTGLLDKRGFNRWEGRFRFI